ncbi:uncharacterized protein LOC131632072 isoform X2 [Vicia villosa]|uniref:uncharacterized protein LOC131632072 isoform X2 n=1 Tax=Vicia villosa TaxID=3911 RepID=UPI00273BD063|nr:uncharacterized protein LOC131632072 isoform X2 [Vicia villosa]
MGRVCRSCCAHQVFGASGKVALSDHSSKEISTLQSLKEMPAPKLTVMENTVKIVDIGDGSDGNAGRSKKPAWNKLANRVVIETGPVKGAESWPALSESTKVSAKSIAESDSKDAVADGSTSTSQLDDLLQLNFVLRRCSREMSQL